MDARPECSIFFSGDALKEQAKKAAMEKLDKEVPPKSPWYLKMFFPVCGTVGTLKTMSCVVPKEVKDVSDPLLKQLE